MYANYESADESSTWALDLLSSYKNIFRGSRQADFLQNSNSCRRLANKNKQTMTGLAFTREK